MASRARLAADATLRAPSGALYAVAKYLGGGAFGAVYKVRGVGGGALSGEHALKWQGVTGDGSSKLAEREAQLHRQLVHRCVVRCFDAWVDDDGDRTGVCAVLELCTGGSLKDLIATAVEVRDAGGGHAFMEAAGPGGTDHFTLLLCDMVDALAYCGRKGVVHCDIKPDNILVDNNMQFKLADFGLSSVVARAGEYSTAEGARGTPHYMAPEVYAAWEAGEVAQFSPWTDAYSLGLMLLEALRLFTRPVLGGKEDVRRFHEMKRNVDVGDREHPNATVVQVLRQMVRHSVTSRLTAGGVVELLSDARVFETSTAQSLSALQSRLRQTPHTGPRVSSHIPAASSPLLLEEAVGQEGAPEAQQRPMPAVFPRPEVSNAEGQEGVPVLQQEGAPVAQQQPLPDVLSRPLAEWDVACVALWLRWMGLPSYESAFAREHVAGSLLADADDELLRDIGVERVVHRRRMLDFVKQRSGQAKQATASASAARIGAQGTGDATANEPSLTTAESSPTGSTAGATTVPSAATPTAADVALRERVVGIVSSMRGAMQDPAEQIAGMASLGALAKDSAARAIVAGGGGVAAIVGSMRAHGLHAGVQEKGCEALYNLAVNVDNRVTIAREGGIAAILQAMRTHFSTAGVQEKACAALWLLEVFNAENKIAIGRDGGVVAIVAAMRTHAAHVGVQEMGCAALWILGVQNNDNKVAIAREGGIAAIVSAMRAHGDCAGVQEYGAAAQWILAVNAENREAIAREGGIAAILSAMRTHGGHVGVQEKGCGALWVLAASAENKLSIVRDFGIAAVLSAMHTHGGDATLQKNGCGALFALTESMSAEAKAALRREGVLEGVVKLAMANHRNDANIQTLAKKILNNM